MKRGCTLLLAVVVVVVVGCGSGSTDAVRTVTAVTSCLRAHGIGASTIVPLSGALPPGFVRHEQVVAVLRDGIGIRMYPTVGDAARAFATEKTQGSVVQYGNAVVTFLYGMPWPTTTRARRIERCAFGPHAKPANSPLVADIAHPDTGRDVMLQTGCLACHRLGNQGNNGPGPNLSNIGAELSARVIARTLRHPVAPMPSFALNRRDFRALVSYLSHLRTP